MKNSIKILIVFFIILFSVSESIAVPRFEYGKPVKFTKNETSDFQHFRFKYLGLFEFSYPDYPSRKFSEHLFEVTSDTSPNRILISWGSGLGEIAPTYFSYAGSEFVLELQSSKRMVEAKKNIPTQHFIIWMRRDFEKQS